MKLGAPYMVNGFACLLLAGIVVAACGSDADKRADRDGGGAAGEGGDRFTPAAGGGEMQPELGGNGGELTLPSGGMGGEAAVAGMGGEPVGMAGAPQLPVGGEGGTLNEGGAGGAPVALDCDAIVIEDTKLDAAVRAAIGKPTGVIVPADVAGLTTLGTHEVATLAGIECLSNLTDLNLNMNGGAPSTVSDLTPLSFLKKLVTLDLTHIDPDDVAPLASLPTLKVLTLTDAIRSQDLSPLGAAPALEELWLDNNVVEDLSALAGIATLKTLSLDISTLNVPASINTLKNIKILSVDNTPLSLANVSALTQLQELYASGSAPRAGIGSINGLVNLTTLDVQSAGITSISSLAGMTKLVTLILFQNDVADITALSGLPNLKLLSLQQNDITNLTPLVDNAGIGLGDSIQLATNPLNCTSEGPKVAALVARGATVGSPCN